MNKGRDKGEPTVPYSVSVQRVEARPLAVVRERMPIREVSSRFSQFLDQVYAAARGNALVLDGLNVFVYHHGPTDTAEVEFGVGVREPFPAIGRVEYSETPSGNAATTTHWGDYAALGAAHDAVIAWCKESQRKLAGVSWEVYGHWSDDPAKVRTDIFYLLESTAD